MFLLGIVNVVIKILDHRHDFVRPCDASAVWRQKEGPSNTYNFPDFRKENDHGPTNLANRRESDSPNAVISSTIQ
jgi:hypothetical protein